MRQVEGIRETVLLSFQKSMQLFCRTNERSVQCIVGITNNIVSAMQSMGSKMSDMAVSINGLSEKADSINKFVTTITSISDQTNLLALTPPSKPPVQAMQAVDSVLLPTKYAHLPPKPTNRRAKSPISYQLSSDRPATRLDQ